MVYSIPTLHTVNFIPSRNTAEMRIQVHDDDQLPGRFIRIVDGHNIFGLLFAQHVDLGAEELLVHCLSHPDELGRVFLARALLHHTSHSAVSTPAADEVGLRFQYTGGIHCA